MELIPKSLIVGLFVPPPGVPGTQPITADKLNPFYGDAFQLEDGLVAGAYVEGTSVTPTAYLDLRTQLGQDRSGTVILEYGTGRRNCKSYAKARTIDQQATRVYGLGSGSTLVSVASDSGAETGYNARREDVICIWAEVGHAHGYRRTRSACRTCGGADRSRNR